MGEKIVVKVNRSGTVTVPRKIIGRLPAGAKFVVSRNGDVITLERVLEPVAPWDDESRARFEALRERIAQQFEKAGIRTMKDIKRLIKQVRAEKRAKSGAQ